VLAVLAVFEVLAGLDALRACDAPEARVGGLKNATTTDNQLISSSLINSSV
jgi:hypothetical protein